MKTILAIAATILLIGTAQAKDWSMSAMEDRRETQMATPEGQAITRGIMRDRIAGTTFGDVLDAPAVPGRSGADSIDRDAPTFSDSDTGWENLIRRNGDALLRFDLDTPANNVRPPVRWDLDDMDSMPNFDRGMTRGPGDTGYEPGSNVRETRN